MDPLIKRRWHCIPSRPFSSKIAYLRSVARGRHPATSLTFPANRQRGVSNAESSLCSRRAPRERVVRYFVRYFAPSIIFPYFIITSPIARIISPRIWIMLGESVGAGVIIGPL